MRGHWLDSMLACRHSWSGGTLDKRKSGLGILEPLEVWSTLGSKEILTDSQVKQHWKKV